MPEPSLSNKTYLWEFKDSTGYVINSAITFEDNGEGARLGYTEALLGDIVEDLDDNDFSNWFSDDTATQDLSLKRFGVSSAKFESSVNDDSQLNLGGGVSSGTATSYLFYDNGALGTTNRIIQLKNGVNGRIFFFGYRPSTSNTNYSYRSDGAWIDSGIVRSVGWHDIKYLVNNTTGTVCYLDGQQLFSNAVLISHPEIFAVVTNTINQPLWIDRILHNRAIPGLYVPTGDLITADVFPTRVIRWLSRSFSISSDDYWRNNKSNVVLSFKASTDGGLSWGTNSPNYNDDNYSGLNDNNLKNIKCDGDGLDGIRIRITLNIFAEKQQSPLINQLTLSYADSSKLYDAKLYDANLGC